MADTKATALSAFTPITTDLLYGVDDPGGAPISGKVTFGDVYALGAKSAHAAGTLTTSQPMTLTQTWNDGAVTFTGYKVNVTDSASAAASRLADFQVGGSSVAYIDKSGMFVSTRNGTGFQIAVGGQPAVGLNRNSAVGGLDLFGNDAGDVTLNLASNTVLAKSSVAIGWASSVVTQPMDTGLARNAAGVVEVNNGSGGTYRDLLARSLRSNAVAFASAPTGVEGMVCAFTDSTTNVWGATITGGGANHVLGYFNGTNWTVMAK